MRDTLVCLELILVTAAILFATILGTGSSDALLAPCYIALGSALAFSAVRRFRPDWCEASGGSMASWLVLAGLGYFVTRAINSDVEAFGLAEAKLAGILGSGVILCQDGYFRRRLIDWLPWMLGVALVVQLPAAISQLQDPNSLTFRGARADVTGASGFFAHRIAFGTFSALTAIIALGFSMYKEKGVLLRLASGGLGLLATAATCASQSRGPIVTLLLGALFVGGGMLVLRSLQRGQARANTILLLLCLFGGVAAASIVVIGSVATIRSGGSFDLQSVFSNIGARNSHGDLVLGNSRGPLFELALKCKPENFLFGGGSGFFSYEVLRIWDDGIAPVWLNDPRYVHNEYLEALLSFGFIGVLLLSAMIVTVSLRGGLLIAKGSSHSITTTRTPDALIFAVCALAVCIVTSIHSSVNFVLHFQSTLIIVGLVGGFLLSFGAKSSRTQSEIPMGILAVCLSIFFLTGSFKFALFIPDTVGQKNTSLTDGELYERGLALGSHEDLVVLGNRFFDRAMAEVWHDPERAHQIGADGKIELETAATLYAAAIDNHPFYPPALINFARISEWQNNHSEAHERFVFAKGLVGGRERHSPVMDFAAENLYIWGLKEVNKKSYESAALKLEAAKIIRDETRRFGRGAHGQKTAMSIYRYSIEDTAAVARAMADTSTATGLWFEERKPEEALGLFLRAKSRYDSVKSDGLRAAEWLKADRKALKEKIDFLEATQTVAKNPLPVLTKENPFVTGIVRMD